MITRIADTFTDALAQLQPQEQKQAKLTAIDLQLDPTGKGLSFHRIENSRDPDFWSVRVSRDIRIIVHKRGDSLLLAYVDHHDDAYDWAECKKIETHPRTGAAQFVEMPIVERPVEAAAVPADEPNAIDEPQPFWALSDDQLLDVGVPPDWLQPVRETRESELGVLFERLPGEAAEALLDVATGGDIKDHIAPVEREADPFAHPDAGRRFRTVDNIEELKAALDQPFEKWAVFLHPAQRELVTRDWSGPARVAGTAGTGKTIVALHRAVHLAGRDDANSVLLTTFSTPLANALCRKLAILTEAKPGLRKRISVQALDEAARSLFEARFGPMSLADKDDVLDAIEDALARGLGRELAPRFLFEEWSEVVDGWQVANEEDYVSIPRLGRKTRLGPQQRKAAWAVFDHVRYRLADRGLHTWPMVYAKLRSAPGDVPFTHIVVDEAQDISVAQLSFLARLELSQSDSLFFAGDLGQRIFRLPFSWLRLGIDIRGRSHSLKVCYRTSHQIRATADRLLPDEIADVDGVEEGRRGTVSVFEGPAPQIFLTEDRASEAETVAQAITGWIASGYRPDEVAILVRSVEQMPRVSDALAKIDFETQGIATAVMHEAKGLEFRAVAVMACDDDVIPDPTRLTSVGDPADLEAAYDTERHLLYVACTRARDRLLVTGVRPGSEFLEDMRSS